MASRSRLLLVLLALLLAPLGVSACGGDDGDGGSNQDVSKLLEQTFGGGDGKDIKSGKVAVAIKVDAKGVEGLNGPIDVKLDGPFASQGKGKLGKFALKATLGGGGQNISASLTHTGDKAFLNLNGTDYAVPDAIYKDIVAGYAQAVKEADKEGEGPSLGALGIKPQTWLKNPRNAGEAKVGDDDTIKITGDVDVPKLLDDVNKTLAQASKLGTTPAGEVPDELTAKQRQQIADALKNLKVEIYTGKEDKILRRLLVAFDIVIAEKDRKSAGLDSASVRFDLGLTDLNEEQKFTAPQNAKPLEELLAGLGEGLGLGGLGSGSGSGSGSGGSGSGGSGSGSSGDLQEYSDCLTAAGTDLAKAQECAKLLEE